MQTWITDYSLTKSAQNLDTKRLAAQIYESIHILASLLNINDKLVTPKQSVSKHPVARLWLSYETNLFVYILVHQHEWQNRFNFKPGINYKNIKLLESKIYAKHILMRETIHAFSADLWLPYWVSGELINSHKASLIRKKPGHYRKLWPDANEMLQMHYNWRKDDKE